MTRGADPSIQNESRNTSIEALDFSPYRASSISGVIGLTTSRPVEELKAGRQRIRSYITLHSEKFESLLSDIPDRVSRDWVASYWKARSSDRFVVQIGNNPWHLFDTSFFDHLWFLSFLIWLLVVYIVLMCLHWTPSLSHIGYAMVCILAGQYFMGAFGASFGPDTEFGLLPAPHLLTYYAGFFFLGSILKSSPSMQQWVKTHWWWILLVSLMLFPLALATMKLRPLACILQPSLALGMSFGSIGLFQYFVRTPSKSLRWLADSSYWLYLAHIPVVIVAQFAATSWSIPAWAKFVFVLAISHLILLVSYQWFVRHSWVGRLLHGPKHPSTPPVRHFPANPS